MDLNHTQIERINGKRTARTSVEKKCTLSDALTVVIIAFNAKVSIIIVVNAYAELQ